MFASIEFLACKKILFCAFVIPQLEIVLDLLKNVIVITVIIHNFPENVVPCGRSIVFLTLQGDIALCIWYTTIANSTRSVKERNYYSKYYQLCTIFQEMSSPVVVRGDHAPRHQHQERGAAGDVSEERGAHLPRQPEGIAPGAEMGAGVAPASLVLLLTALCWQVIPGTNT